MISLEIIAAINDNFVWGAPMLCLMLFTGVSLTVRTGFFQLRKFPHILKSTVFSRERNSADGISPFAAMCQALAATLGTGNIAGVATALSIGGAGAVFWMWISAFFGMMTGYAENVLGILYRKKDGEKYKGGAMQYIRNGLSESPKTRPLAKPLSVIYALLCVAAGFGMGNAAQMNSASEALLAGFGLPPIVTGVVLAVLAAVIVFGGAKRISAVSSKLVPLMSGFYIIGCVYILFANADKLPDAFGMIFSSAFGFRQIGGGIAGAAVKSAVSMGFKRGVFSNEAGLGTSVFAHSQSQMKHPVVCGMWSVFEIFFDTIIMCTLTALVLLVSDVRADIPAEIPPVTASTQYFRLRDNNAIITDGETLPPSVTAFGIHGEVLEVPLPQELTYSNIMVIQGEEIGGRIVSARIEPLRGVALTECAFSARFGKPAGAVLAILVAMFAFSTVIGWCYFGGECTSFLFGEGSRKVFCVLFIAFSIVGACVNMQLAWGIADLLNGLMAIPNLFAVLCLSRKVVAVTKDYCKPKIAVKKIKSSDPPAALN